MWIKSRDVTQGCARVPNRDKFALKRVDAQIIALMTLQSHVPTPLDAHIVEIIQCKMILYWVMWSNPRWFELNRFQLGNTCSLAKPNSELNVFFLV